MDSNSSLKLAVAVALLRSKLQPKPSDSTSSLSESDAQRWKKKAKERKRELIRLKEELRELEDGTQYDLFPLSASCKCYFFDNFGKLSPKRVHVGDECHRRFNEVLHRRFLRQVRSKERRRRSDGSIQRRRILELDVEDGIEQISASVDFLLELCKTLNSAENDASLSNLSHQAVDFILDSSKNLLAKGKNREPIEGIINSLITQLLGRMCTPSQINESSCSGFDTQFYVQHLIRKLGCDPYIGQSTMLAVSQRITVLADSLVFMDPFDDAFPDTHSCMFMFSNSTDKSFMIQLIEFLISDYTQTWTSEEDFDGTLFEEWMTSVLEARKALGLLENRNGLYVLYMDRVIGELAKQVDGFISQ